MNSHNIYRLVSWHISCMLPICLSSLSLVPRMLPFLKYKHFFIIVIHCLTCFRVTFYSNLNDVCFVTFSLVCFPCCIHRNFVTTTTLYSTVVAQWLRCCATNRKVAGSIPAGVSGFFIDIKSFRSQYGPGIDSASNRNEYQEYFLGVKAASAYGWQPNTILCRCHEIWEP